MAARTIEAQLVLSGQDRGAAKVFADVAKAMKLAEDQAKVTKPIRELAKTFEQVAEQKKLVDQALAARKGVDAASAGLAQLRDRAAEVKVRVEAARQATQAFENQKVTKGTEIARQMAEATKGYRDVVKVQRDLDRQVGAATREVAAQTTALRQSEQALRAAGAPMQALERHQRELAVTYDRTTTAIQRQIRIEQEAARAATVHARERVEAAHHVRQHGVVGAVGAVATGAVSVHGVTHIMDHAARAGAEVQGVRVDLESAGIKAAERSHIESESLALAARYKNVTQASVMELWKEMRSVMTDPHEVDHVIDPMTRAKSILDARDKTGTASHGLGLLVKGAEAIGAAKDPERFTHLLDGYIKAMQVMGKTITPEGIYEMQKYSKTSGGRWSDRFILTTAQSLGQELGGSTAGNSIDIATKQIVGGMQNLHSKAKEFARVGLIDPKNLDVLKTGEVKGTKAGVQHAVKGDDLAASDLDKWVYTYLLPALESHNIKSEKDQLSWVQKNFTGTGANVVSKLIQQRESFEAHAKMYGDATGLGGVDLNKDDPTAALGGLSKSLETFAGVLTSPIMKDAGHGLDYLASGVSSFSLKLEAFNKEHPDLAKWEAPAAGAVGLVGAGGASLLVWKALNGGFGLKGSATALDASALKLSEAAVALGAKGGGPGQAPGGNTPGLGARGLLYALGLPGLVANAPSTPEETSRNAVALDKTVRSWMPDWLSQYFTPIEAEGAKAGHTAGVKLGEGVSEGVKEKGPEVTQQGRSLWQLLQDSMAEAIKVPISLDVQGVPSGGEGAGGASVQRASFSGGVGGLIQRASLGSSDAIAKGIVSGDAGPGTIGHGDPVAIAEATLGANGAQAQQMLRSKMTPGEWCADFVNGVIKGSGGQGVNSSMARAFNTWGRAVAMNDAKRGDVILERHGNHVGHVGLATGNLRRDANGNVTAVEMISGNYGHRVKRNWERPGIIAGLRRGEPRPVPVPKPKNMMPEQELPPGYQGRGGAHLQDAALDRLDGFANRLESMEFNSIHRVQVETAPGTRARTVGMRSQHKGPVQGNVGVSMPHAETESWNI